MSDMAVNTTGIKNIDSIQTGELCKEAWFFLKILFQVVVFLFQKYSWVDHLMKLFSLEKRFLRKLKCLNQNPVEKTPKKAS
jgi:23S rRNA (uridine2552-2'-O)-methyltransferase